jgi:hypothetical protein
MASRCQPTTGRVGAERVCREAAAVLVMLGLATPLAGQTDYFNLDKNRPVRIEDAYATERYAFELKVAPLRLERETGGAYHWGFDPEIAYGVLPRTHVELGLPWVLIDEGEAGRRSGLTGVELSALHNLNVETRGLPAFGIRGDVLLPVGGLSLDRAYPAVTGLMTRSYRWARFHVNAQYTFGAEPDGAGAGEPGEPSVVASGEEVSRWLAGMAVDRPFPLRALLVLGDVYARQPLHAGDPVEWNAGVGFRYQVNPYLAVDAGLGRRLTGASAWYVTVGSAYAFALRPLIPVPH